MSTDIAVREPGTVAIPVEQATVPGIEGFGRDEMVIPRLRLVQAQSGFSDNAGTIHNNMTGIAKDTITIIVIGAKKGRVKWPKDYKRDQEPDCASDDGVRAREGLAGVEQDRQTPTAECARCIYSQWSTEDSGKRIPPPCSMVLNFLVVDVEDDLPSLISFKRTSMAAGKQLVTLVKSFGFKRTFLLSAVQEQGDTGKYYVLKVQAADAVVPERLAHYVALAEQFREQTITTDTEDEGAARRSGVRGADDTSFVPEEYERQG